MRALKSSMLSKTTARPRCFSRRGVAAEGLITAPVGARLPRSTAMPACSRMGLARSRITSRFQHGASAVFSPMVLPLTVSASRVNQFRQFAHHRGNAAGVIEILHQEAAGGHQIDQQRKIVSQAVEIVEVELHAHAPGHGQQMHHGVGRSADGGVHADGVLECLAREDLREPEVLVHHLHDAPAGHDAPEHSGGNRPPEWPRSAAGPGPAPPPCWPWWRRCPWSCSGRPSATCKLRLP